MTTSPIKSSKMLTLQKKYCLSADQMYKVARLLELHSIKRLPSGNFQVRSLSRPLQFHTVNPRYESCSCEWARGDLKMCSHLAAWIYLRDMSMDEVITYQSIQKQQYRESVARTWKQSIRETMKP